MMLGAYASLQNGAEAEDEDEDEAVTEAETDADPNTSLCTSTDGWSSQVSLAIKPAIQTPPPLHSSDLRKAEVEAEGEASGE